MTMNMQRFTLILCPVVFALSCVAGQASESKPDDNVMKEKSAIKQVAGDLQTELKASIQAGGPVAAKAISVVRL